MINKSFIIFCLSALAYFSCETRTSKKAENQERKNLQTLKLNPMPMPVEEYPDAILELAEPSGYEVLKPGSINFLYDVKNFPIHSGNYISLILNNGLYFRSNSPTLTASLAAGNYFSLSFLCLPNQVSLKNYGNYVARMFTVGEAGEFIFNDTAPMIFYHHPRGRIKDENQGWVLLDFYLLNTTLSPEGNQVKVEIEGKEFMISEWKPYRLEGLDKGTYEITLTLLDENGRKLPSPLNPAWGSFTFY